MWAHWIFNCQYQFYSVYNTVNHILSIGVLINNWFTINSCIKNLKFTHPQWKTLSFNIGFLLCSCWCHRIKGLTAREVEMRKAIVELEGKVANLSTAHQESASSRDGKLRSQQQELSSATTELATLCAEVASLRQELTSARTSCQVAEEKYSHEMMLHANDMQVSYTVINHYNNL